MTQFTSGIYRLTQIPLIYKAIPHLLPRKNALSKFVAEMIQPIVGEAVLDLGCGPGTFCPFLAGTHYKGIDLNVAHIAAARERFKGLDFECCDAGAFLTSTNQKFDLILLIGLLHHLDDNHVLSVMRGCLQVLNVGGRIVALDPAFEEHQNPIAYALARLDSGRNVRYQDQYLKLVQEIFPNSSGFLRRDLLRVPYTHAVTICRTESCLVEETQRRRV